MRRILAKTETSSEAVWTILSRHLADATQLVNCSTAAGQQPRNSCCQGRVSPTPGNPGNLLEFNWSPGNFCVIYRRSTALVSSHKNMDKYLLQKYKIYRHRMCSFKFQMHKNPLPQISVQLGRTEIPVLWVFQLSEGCRSKANMSWIFLKIPPGIWKFAWLNL